MESDTTISKKKGYELLINNDEPEAVHLITREWQRGITDSNLVIIYREDLQKVIDELTKCK